MKAHYIILCIVVILAVYVGLNINDQQPISSPSPDRDRSAEQQPAETASSIDPSYVMEYLADIGFTVSPVFDGATTDIYTAKYTIPDSYIRVQVDVYFERSSQQVLLVESNIDASWYVEEPNQQYYEDYVNEVAHSYFGAFATLPSLPYEGSEPDVARTWVESNIISSYTSETPGKTSTAIGPATINLFGSPLLRTLEIDFGF